MHLFRITKTTNVDLVMRFIVNSYHQNDKCRFGDIQSKMRGSLKAEIIINPHADIAHNRQYGTAQYSAHERGKSQIS